MYIIKRISSKITREIWRMLHPQIWGCKLQINGIPEIIGNKKLKLGKNISINDDVVIQAIGNVVIGNNVTISRGCTILTTGLDTNNYKENWKKTLRDHIVKDVVIEDGVWLGACVTVTPGAYIAEGTIVASGAVVVGKLKETNALYGGVPAKLLKKYNIK